MPVVSAICVFCGASPGDDPAFMAAAAAFGRAVATAGRALIYGGSKTGLMGEVANAALAAGGRVTGVIPRGLVDKELAHPFLTELRVVAGMHDRKATMSDLADAFVVLPGGLGTLEEFFEVWTWAQLGLHAKPVGLLSVPGFFAPLLQFLDGLVTHRFVRREHRDLLIVDDDPTNLLARLDAWQPPVARPKWIARGEE
ncbi:MAG TPA: TIGR00730 family Rossman fold protein [Polyangia bacterium]